MLAVSDYSVDDMEGLILGVSAIGLLLLILYRLFFHFFPALFFWFLSLICSPQAKTPAVGPIDEFGNPQPPPGHTVASMLKLCVRKSVSFLFVTGLMQAMFYLVAMSWMFVSMSLDISTIETTSTSDADTFEIPTSTTSFSAPSYSTPTPAPVGKRTSMMRTAMPIPTPTALGSTMPSSMPSPVPASALSPNPFVQIFTFDKPFPAWVMMQYFDLPIHTAFAIALLIHLLLRCSDRVFSLLARALAIWVISYLAAAAVMLASSRYDVDHSLSLVIAILVFMACVSILNGIVSWLKDLGTQKRDTTMDVAAHAAAHAAAHSPAQQALYESQLSNVQRIVKNIFLSDEDLASGPVEDVIRFLQKDCWKTAGSLFFAVAESLRERFVSIDKSLAGLLKSSAGIKTRVDEHSGTILGNTNEIKHLRKLKADKTRVDEVIQAHKSLFDKVNGFFLYTKEDAEALKTAQQGVNQLRGTVDGFQNTKANDTDLQATLATVKDLDGTVKQLNGTVSGLEDLKVDVKDLKAAQQTLGELHDKLGDLDTIKAKASGFQETVETVTGLTGRINVLESANTEFMPWKEEMDNVTSKTSGEISSMKDSKAESKDLEKTDMELNLLSGKVDKLDGSKADDANALKATQKTVEQLTTKVHNLDNTKIDESAITTSKEFLLRELSTHKINTSREIVEMGLDIQGLRNTKADRNILDTTRDTLNPLSSKVNGLDSRPADVTDLTDVTSRLDGLDTSLQAMGARHDDLSDRINGLATPVDGLDTASIQVMGEQQGHLTNRVLSLETDRNKSSKRLADTEKAKDTLKADLAVARKDIVSVSKSASNNDAAIGKLRDQKASVKLLDAANARIDDLQKELDAKNSEHQKDKAAMQAQMNALIKRFDSMPQWVGATEPARVQPEDLLSIREQVSSEVTQQIDELRSKTASQHEEVVKAHDEHKKYVLAEFETCAYHDDVQDHIKNCRAQGIQTQVDAIQQKLASLNNQHVSDTSFRDTIRGTIYEALRSEIFEAVVNTVVQNNSERDYSHEDIVAAVEEEFNSMEFRDQILATVTDNCTSVLRKHRNLNASSPHNSSLRLINGGQPTHGEYGHHQNVDTIPMGSYHENRTVEDKLGSGDGSPGDHPGLISGGPATSPTDEPPRVYTGEQAPYTDDDDDGASSSRNLKGKGPCPPDGLTYAQRNGSATPESAVDGDQEWQSGEDEETDDEDDEDDEDDPDHGQDSDDDDDDEDGNDHDQSQGGANGHSQSGTGDHDHQGDGSQHHHGGQDPTHGGHDEAAADGTPGPASGTHTKGQRGKCKSDAFQTRQQGRTRKFVSKQRGREDPQTTRAREERRAARIAARWEARQQVQRERKAAAAAAAAANAAPGPSRPWNDRRTNRSAKCKARQNEAEEHSPTLAKLNRESFSDEAKIRKIAEAAERQSRRDRAKASFRGSSSGSSRGSRGSGRGRGNGRGGWGSGRGTSSNAEGTSGNANGTGNNTNGTGTHGGWSNHDGPNPCYNPSEW